jgi:hypothetical protein
VIVEVAPQIASVITPVAAELGVAIAPASMSQLHITGVAYRAIAGEAPITRLGLAYRRGETSPIVRNFIARAVVGPSFPEANVCLRRCRTSVACWRCPVPAAPAPRAAIFRNKLFV